MKLRTIVTLLSIMVILSTAIGVFYYYYSIRESAYAVAYRRAVNQTERLKNQISTFLTVNMKPVRALAGLKEIKRAAEEPDSDNLAEANVILDHFKRTLDVDVCYLMDGRGITIASSNRFDKDSFIGQDFGFRPYFKNAMEGRPYKYMALGTMSKKRGAYYSHPVYGIDISAPVAVVVIKATISAIEEGAFKTAEGITMLTGPGGVIFSSNRSELVLKTIKELSLAGMNRLAASRQYGEGPWKWSGLRLLDGNMAMDASGAEYTMFSQPIDNFSNWHVVRLLSISEISESVLQPLVRTTSWIVLTLFLLAGVSVYYLYRKADREIALRIIAEEHLRESEERYRLIYHKTPAMLHSIDPDGRILRVSDYWCEAMGYEPGEVIGRKLTDFLTDDSRKKAEDEVLPAFFAKGYCEDVAYQFVKKSGQVIDVLLSAISEKDSFGAITRSLAVVVDITERKKAEEQLRQAKEQLSNYSKDLERQVRERTREVTGFLNYTPAIVYMKDTRGRYILVNPRHEHLFGIKNDQIKGKTVYDIFPEDTADNIRRNDLRVLEDKKPYQAEEEIPHGGVMHNYLSVRFPILDEMGEVDRLCGISVDITDLKKARDKLRRLSGSIISNQEKERTAIARELHDELGQVLTALRMDVVWLKERLEKNDPAGAARALTMCDIIDSTITEVGGIARRLRPAVLDDLGLIEALEWHASDFEKRTGIVSVFKSVDVPVVNAVTAITVYRVAQEALTNAARHSGADHVYMNLSAQNGLLVLSVVDDGRGFDQDENADQEGFGLSGMRERAYLAGGDLEIKTASGQGTEVRLSVPVEKRE